MIGEETLNKNKLFSASELEAAGILKKTTAWKLAKAKKIPCYLVGPKGGGVRFRIDEVLEALRQPMAVKEAGE